MSPITIDDRRSHQIRSLTEVSRALTYAVTFEQVLQLSVERAAQLIEAHAAVLMLADEDGLLTIRASVGVAAPDPTRAHSLDDTLMEQLQRVLGVTAERFLGVPLVVNGEVTGILAVALPIDTVCSDEQEWLLSALADQAAVALEKTRLDERGRFRDRLIGIVSHDLRNPINTVVLGTSMLLDNEALDPLSAKVLTRIQAAAERAGRMIGDLLDYTQAHLGGGIHIARKPADLDLIVRQVIDELEITHPDHVFELVSGGDMAAELDLDRIAQAIGNLLSNAVSYSTAGTRVRIELGSDGGSVSCAIHNTGATIPAERLRRIFEPMQQLIPGSGRGQRSVGLGLYIVESIMLSHHGTVDVTSSDDAGTTFTLRVPRLASAHPHRAATR